MRKILLVLPVPVPEAGRGLFRGQIPREVLRPGTEVEFAFPRDGGRILDSYYDDALSAAFVLEAAHSAESAVSDRAGSRPLRSIASKRSAP